MSAQPVRSIEYCLNCPWPFLLKERGVDLHRPESHVTRGGGGGDKSQHQLEHRELSSVRHTPRTVDILEVRDNLVDDGSESLDA